MMQTQAPAVERLAHDLIVESGRLIRIALADAPSAMSPARARTLVRLRENGPLRVTELARLEHCTQPSMTSIVDRLEAAGHVTRRTDDADGRAVLVALTEEGDHALDESREAMANAFAPRLRRLNEAELAQLAAHTATLRRLMEDLDS